MSILEYLASRAAFIIFHLFAGALGIAVIQLDLLQTGGSGLTYGSSAYIVVLHVAMLGIAVVIDYSRQYAFFRRAREIAAAPDPIALVPSPRPELCRAAHPIAVGKRGIHITHRGGSEA